MNISDNKNAVIPAADDAAQKPGEQILSPAMSKGEKLYNRLVYQGLNYWANLGISMVITDFFLHGKGKNFFHNSVAASAEKLAATGIKKPTAKWLSEIALGTFSLNSGGNILLIPTKYLEDNKRSIVHWFNDKLGVDQTAADGHKLTADEIYIEQEQDKQSWPRMIGRRFLGWGATTVVGLTLDHVAAQKLNTPQMINGELVTHKPGQQVFTEKTVQGANYVLNNFVPGGAKIAENPTAQRYMGYAALDWIYTIITSKILHATNGAHKQKMPKEVGDDKPNAPANTTAIATQEIPVDTAKPKTLDKILARKPAENHVARLQSQPSEMAQLSV